MVLVPAALLASFELCLVAANIPELARPHYVELAELFTSKL